MYYLVLVVVILLFMPDSPFYLVRKGRDEEARKALQWLRGNQYDIEEEFASMVETDKEQKAMGTISLGEFVSKKVYILPGLIMMALMFLQRKILALKGYK